MKEALYILALLVIGYIVGVLATLVGIILTGF